MTDQILSVSQLNEYIRMMMDSNSLLSNVFIRGEISNFTNHYKTGHFYFSVKDESALVRAVMFRSYASRVPFVPENGMKVILHGRVSVFPRDGQYQIYVDDMQPDGLGSLRLAYEQLRRKLEAQGLFDSERKRLIPGMPMRIGIITSPTGAAVRDMIQILGRRFPLAELIVYPALVQGSGAPESLISGLRCFAEQIPVDLIIIGRGGGSEEDLFAFNDEALAYAVAASPVPVISAVGHETDVTICDFVADLRAPTPSAAAELAVPDMQELRQLIEAMRLRMISLLRDDIANARTRVQALAGSGALRSPRYYLEDKRMTVAYLESRLQSLSQQRVTEAKAEFGALCAKLDTLNPLRVLSRGYAAVFDDAGAPVVRAEALSAGDTLHIRFSDKTADAVVSGIRESE